MSSRTTAATSAGMSGHLFQRKRRATRNNTPECCLPYSGGYPQKRNHLIAGWLTDPVAGSQDCAARSEKSTHCKASGWHLRVTGDRIETERGVKLPAAPSLNNEPNAGYTLGARIGACP